MKRIDDATECRTPAAIHDPAIPDEIPNQIGDGVEQGLAAIGSVHVRAPLLAAGGTAQAPAHALNCRKLERRP